MTGFDEEQPFSEGPRRAGAPIDRARLLRAFVDGKGWILLAAVAGIAGGVAASKFGFKPSYEASAVIQWEPDVGDEERVAPHPRELQTMLEAIQLSTNLAQVAKRLELPEGAVSSALEVDNDGRSSVINLKATAPSAEQAAGIANTSVEVFAEHQRRLHNVRRRDLVRSLEADVAAANAKLKVAQQGYDAFRAKLGVADLNEAIESTTKELSEVESEVERLRSEIDAFDATERTYRTRKRRHRARTSLSTSVSNPAQAALAEAEAQLAADMHRLAPNHPSLLRQQAKLGALRRAAASKSQTISSGTFGLNPEHVAIVAGMREAGISKRQAETRLVAAEKLVEKKKARLSELKAAQGTGTVLSTEVGVADERLLQLTLRLSEARDALRSEFPGFRILASAEPPERPLAGHRTLISLLIPVLSVLLALLGLLARALWGMRVHTAREVGYWVNAPVVTTSAWPRESTALPCLVAELSDGASVSSGTTLVIGATPREAPLAREVAQWVERFQLQSQQTEREPGTALTVTGPRLELIEGEIDDPDSQAEKRYVDPRHLPVVRAWDGALSGQAVRRAARLADRVLVLVSSGAYSATQLARVRERIGREQGVGVMLIDAADEVCELADRVGDVDGFWEEARRSVA